MEGIRITLCYEHIILLLCYMLNKMIILILRLKLSLKSCEISGQIVIGTKRYMKKYLSKNDITLKYKNVAELFFEYVWWQNIQKRNIWIEFACIAWTAAYSYSKFQFWLEWLTVYFAKHKANTWSCFVTLLASRYWFKLGGS